MPLEPLIGGIYSSALNVFFDAVRANPYSGTGESTPGSDMPRHAECLVFKGSDRPAFEIVRRHPSDCRDFLNQIIIASDKVLPAKPPIQTEVSGIS